MVVIVGGLPVSHPIYNLTRGWIIKQNYICLFFFLLSNSPHHILITLFLKGSKCSGLHQAVKSTQGLALDWLLDIMGLPDQTGQFGKQGHWITHPDFSIDLPPFSKTWNLWFKGRQEEKKHSLCWIWTNSSNSGRQQTFLSCCHLLTNPVRIQPLTCSSNEHHCLYTEQWNYPLSRQALSQEAWSSHGQSSRGGWCGSSKPWPLTWNTPPPASTKPSQPLSQEGSTGGENESMLSDRQWCTSRMRGMSWRLQTHVCNVFFFFTA